MDEQELKPPTRPAWVIWLGIGVLVLVVLAVMMHLLLGGGPHGPRMHG